MLAFDLGSLGLVLGLVLGLELNTAADNFHGLRSHL
jgi:hypothetical protein